MSNDNNQVVKKAKKILKDQGIEIKTTELYEFFSKLSNHPNWNTALAKNVNFSDIFREFTQDIYKNYIFMGFLDRFNGSPILTKVDNLSSFLMIGSNGSGKSRALKQSLKYFIENNTDAEVFLHDPSSEKELDSLKKKTKDISTSKVSQIIDLLYDESIYRENEIKKTECRDLIEYEKYQKLRLKRIIFASDKVEEVLKEVNFMEEYHKDGSMAAKLYHLLTKCKGLGIVFLGVFDEKFFPEKFPLFENGQTILQFFRITTKICRSNEPLHLRSDEKGRCFILGHGYIQYSKD